MKKTITILSLIIFLKSSTGFWDFNRASREGLPPSYLFDRVEETFNSKLKGPCSGLECIKRNKSTNIFNI